MQISIQEVVKARNNAQQEKDARALAPVKSVEELAARQGVKMDEVRRFTARAMSAEEDPLRERRVRELAKRIADGAYSVDSEQLVDMAERRAIADRAADL